VGCGVRISEATAVETCPLASGSRFVCRAQEEVEERRGGGDGSETEGAGLAGAAALVPGSGWAGAGRRRLRARGSRG